MRTRHKAVALAAAVSILAFGPAMAFAQQEQAQAATQVTVDLSELDRSDREEPLAQTGDKRWLLAAAARLCRILSARRPRSAHQTQPETKHEQAALN